MSQASSPAMLTADQQSAVLALLARGASPVLACREVGVEHGLFLATMRHDDTFFERICDVQNLLIGNVSAALYKAALEGKVNAQTFYLRHFEKSATSNDADDSLSDMPLADLKHMLHCELPAIDDDDSDIVQRDPNDRPAL